MENNKVIELLKNYRSYQYAANNCGSTDDIMLPVMISDRRRNPNMWDQTRYNRIVNMIDGAVNHVLSDDQRKIISRKYLDRNTMSLKQIAAITGCDPSTVSRWHTEAIRRLSIALQPLSEEEQEIQNFDHRFNPSWVYEEPA